MKLYKQIKQIRQTRTTMDTWLKDAIDSFLTKREDNCSAADFAIQF